MWINSESKTDPSINKRQTKLHSSNVLAFSLPLLEIRGQKYSSIKMPLCIKRAPCRQRFSKLWTEGLKCSVQRPAPHHNQTVLEWTGTLNTPKPLYPTSVPKLTNSPVVEWAQIPTAKPSFLRRVEAVGDLHQEWDVAYSAIWCNMFSHSVWQFYWTDFFFFFPHGCLPSSRAFSRPYEQNNYKQLNRTKM